jgi:hypothetical protein
MFVNVYSVASGTYNHSTHGNERNNKQVEMTQKVKSTSDTKSVVMQDDALVIPYVDKHEHSYSYPVLVKSTRPEDIFNYVLQHKKDFQIATNKKLKLDELVHNPQYDYKKYFFILNNKVDFDVFYNVIDEQDNKKYQNVIFQYDKKYYFFNMIEENDKYFLVKVEEKYMKRKHDILIKNFSK